MENILNFNLGNPPKKLPHFEEIKTSDLDRNNLKSNMNHTDESQEIKMIIE